MEVKILNTREKKDVLKEISRQWGCDLKTDLVFLLSSRFKIYLIDRSLARIDEKKLRIDRMGLYFCEVMKNKELRLSIEGSQIIGPLAKKNVLNISDGEAKVWLHGNNLIRKSTDCSGFIIIQNNDDFMGCGRFRDEEILNYIPKTRRISSD